MNVSYALSLWPQLMSTNLRLGSPGCTEGGTFSWLEQFMQGVEKNKYRVDFLALHWYGDCTKPDTVSQFFDKVEKQWPSYTYWLTEFSCINGDESVNANFFKEVLPILNNRTKLERYSWFTDRWYALFSFFV